jgi:hypothetical protein
MAQVYGSEKWSGRAVFLTGPCRVHKVTAVIAGLSLSSTVFVRLLAVALAVLSLGAPWLAGWGECRELGCIKASALELSSATFAAPGTPSCPCPASCETEPPGGCAQACDRERESITGRQPQSTRRGSVDRWSLAAAADLGTTSAHAARVLRLTACGQFASSSSSTPLFIRHRTIIR